MRTIITLAALLAAGTVNAGVIDTFINTGPYKLDAPQSVTAAGTSSEGYSRTLSSSNSGYMSDMIDTTSHRAVWGHDQGKDSEGMSFLTYALNEVDLTDGGASNGFRVQLDYVYLLSDPTGTGYKGALDIQVVDSADHAYFQSLPFASIIQPTYVDFLFSNFAGVDFQHVTSVTLGIDGKSAPGLYVVVDTFSTTNVPEPATLALVAAALLGVLATRQRRPTIATC